MHNNFDDYLNTHTDSQHPSSVQSHEGITKIREMILKQYNADPKEYSVIFTHGCTASLKLVGEYFPWSERSQFRYAINSHNSVIGVREYVHFAIVVLFAFELIPVD